MQDNKQNKKNNNEQKVSENQSILTKLNPKMKFFMIFMSIITFGFFWIHLKNKMENKKQEKEMNIDDESKLKIHDKIPFNVNQLLKNLGQKENIKSIDASLNSLKVEFINKELIEQEEVKKLGARGLIFSDNKISIIFGDYAITLKNELNKIIELTITSEIKEENIEPVSEESLEKLTTETIDEIADELENITNQEVIDEEISEILKEQNN